jgi:hypothetical protein
MLVWAAEEDRPKCGTGEWRLRAVCLRIGWTRILNGGHLSAFMPRFGSGTSCFPAPPILFLDRRPGYNRCSVEEPLLKQGISNCAQGRR